MEKPTHVPAENGATVKALGRRGYVVYRQDGSVLSYSPPLEAVCPQCGTKHTDSGAECSTCMQYAGQS